MVGQMAGHLVVWKVDVMAVLMVGEMVGLTVGWMVDVKAVHLVFLMAVWMVDK